MALPAYALATVSDLRSEVSAGSGGADTLLERIIRRVSRRTENRVLRGRRVIYRAPIEVAALVVASILPANGGLAIANQPGGARTLAITITDADRSITAGTLTVTGTVDGVAGQTETFDLGAGVSELHGVKFFTAVSAAAIAGLVGAVDPDRIQVGTSKGYIEYFSPRGCVRQLRSIDWPIQYVAEVNEDLARLYAAGTALVAGSDYLLNARDGELTRLCPGTYGEGFWTYGPRTVRMTSSAGYAGLASVPEDITGFVLEASAAVFREITDRRQGVTDESNQITGHVARAIARITDDMAEDLAEYRAARYAPLPEREAA